MEIVRWSALIILIFFSVYTIFATVKENFWRSFGAVLELKWGRQVVMDLYIGLFLFSFFVYLNEGSILIMLAWLVPFALLGNLVTLLYFIINFQSLISQFSS